MWIRIAIVWILAAASAAASGIAIESFQLADNGDGDPFADSSETVELRLTIRNTTPLPLSGVTLSLSTPDTGTICPVQTEVVVDSLAPGEVRTTDPFIFQVSDLDRATEGFGPYDFLTATLNVEVAGGALGLEAVPARIVMDLDLDASGAGNPISWFEGFEGGAGLGSFVPNNLDFGLHDDEFPEGGLADGYRCQYHRPFCTQADCTGMFQHCTPGSSPANADAIWWQLDGPGSFDGGRAYSGSHSLYFGAPLDLALGHTTPTGVLESAETSAPISIDDSPATAPTLSFRHQLSFIDDRTVNTDPGTTADRAIVSVQLADGSGAAAGPWIKLDPYRVPYDRMPTAQFTNCSFDPIDDGNDEADYFPGNSPWVPPAFGPSSTCAPEKVWSEAGSTTGSGSPGGSGSVGPGTWVESTFDLSRFRGRQLRIRFLASTIRVGTNADYQEAFQFNPDPGDDGWWIDDVTVHGAVDSPALLTIDTQDNSGLPVPADPDADGISASCDNCPELANAAQADGDSDGAGTGCDCDDTNPDTYPGAPEINDGLDNQCGAEPGFGAVDETSGISGFANAADRDEYSWSPQVGATGYEVARAETQAGGAVPLFCVQATVSDPPYVDPETPPLGSAFFYLNRPVSPNPGSWGLESSGQPRSAGTCSGS